jgi:hypothetical protein
MYVGVASGLKKCVEYDSEQLEDHNIVLYTSGYCGSFCIHMKTSGMPFLLLCNINSRHDKTDWEAETVIMTKHGLALVLLV